MGLPRTFLTPVRTLVYRNELVNGKYCIVLLLSYQQGETRRHYTDADMARDPYAYVVGLKGLPPAYGARSGADPDWVVVSRIILQLQQFQQFHILQQFHVVCLVWKWKVEGGTAAAAAVRHSL